MFWPFLNKKSFTGKLEGSVRLTQVGTVCFGFAVLPVFHLKKITPLGQDPSCPLRAFRLVSGQQTTRQARTMEHDYGWPGHLNDAVSRFGSTVATDNKEVFKFFHFIYLILPAEKQRLRGTWVRPSDVGTRGRS